MSNGIRGRALIINISNTKNPRPGSEVDYDSLTKLFGDLNFDISDMSRQDAGWNARVSFSSFYFSESVHYLLSDKLL